ncbi:MAG TPA: mechanosensitive ion channel family protein [Verrucomicrobiae bacterium]
MKLRFQAAWRAPLFLIAVAWAWSVWAAAQGQTNSPSTALTNRPSAIVRTVERWSENPLTFRLDEIDLLREHSFLGEPLWRYAASAVYLLLAFYAAKLLDWTARVWLRRVTGSQGKLKELLLALLRGPIKVVLFVVLMDVGLNLFDWSPTAKLYLSKALVLVVAASLTYLTVRIVGVLLDVWRQRAAPEGDKKFQDQLFSFLHKSLTGFVIVVGVLVTAQNLGVNITAGITSLSIGGLAVGLAAQDTLANLFGAVAVLVDKPFHVGDHIRVEGNEGAVEAVGLRSTRLRHAEGYLIAVPNKTMGNASITNITRRDSIKTTMKLALPQNLPAQKVRRVLAILREVYRAHPNTEDVWVSFSEFADAKLSITLVHWWKGTNRQEYLAGLEELNLAAKEKLDAETIQFV